MLRKIRKFLHILIVFLFSISFLRLTAQGGFRKEFLVQNKITSLSQHIIEAPNKQVITIGQTLDTLNNKVFGKLTLVGTDSLGNYLWRKEYGGLHFSHTYYYFILGNAVYEDGNYFYYTGVVQDTAVRQVGVVIKFNYNGDTIWQKIFRDNIEDVIPQGIIKSCDGGLLITGCFQNWINNTNPTMIMKTDLNGNEIWRKKIHKPAPDFSTGNAIKQDSLSKRIVVVGNQYIGNSNSWNSYSNILITDSLGNKLVQTSFNNADAGGYYDLIQTKDKNFVTCGQWNEYKLNGADYAKHQVVKFNINGQIIWNKKYFKPTYDAGAFILRELEEGDIVVLGVLDSLNELKTKSCRRLILTRLDTNGELVSKKYIGNPMFNNVKAEFPTGLDLTKDGGYLISSCYPFNQNPRPYSIIKVDSTGCDTVAHWCQSVALGSDNFNKLTGYTFEFYPNPANDEINYKLQAPLDYKFSISIRDVSGRVVHEMQPSPSQALTFNTASYPPGVYFIALYANGQCLETKKLVIVH